MGTGSKRIGRARQGNGRDFSGEYPCRGRSGSATMKVLRSLHPALPAEGRSAFQGDAPVQFSPSKWQLACGFAWVAFGTAAPAAEPIPAEKFTQLHTLIKPLPAEEKWAQIPWLSSLWEARQ